MLSSFRNAARFAALALVLASATVHAQQKYFIPEVSLSSEAHTNRQFFTNSAEAQTTELYRLGLGANFGDITPRGKTDVDARIGYRDFSESNTSSLIDGFVDLKSNYDFIRKSFAVEGHFEHQDIVTAETGAAGFDASGNPVTVDSGTIRGRGTRNLYDIAPSFSYDLSEKAFLDTKLQYQAVRFDVPDNIVAARVGFDSPYAELTIGRRFGELTSLSIGPYYTRFKADDGSTRTNTLGSIISMHHDWSAVSNLAVNLRLERNQHQEFLPTPAPETSANSWGLEFVGYRQTQTGWIRYGLGRFLQPSTLGDRLQEDQLRLEFNRAITQRVSWNGAVRLTRDRLANNPNSTNNRDRDFLTLAFSDFLTQRLQLMGGYRFIWQNFQSIKEKAHDNALFLTLTYRGQRPEGFKRSHED